MESLILNRYTQKAPTQWNIDGQGVTYPSYGYHTSIYLCPSDPRIDGKGSLNAFAGIDIKEYNQYVEIGIGFHGQTPNGSAGPHGFDSCFNKNEVRDWKEQIQNLLNKSIRMDFSGFPNPTQYNRSISWSPSQGNYDRTWVADCGSASSFAEKTLKMNKVELTEEIFLLNTWSNTDKSTSERHEQVFIIKLRLD